MKNVIDTEKVEENGKPVRVSFAFSGGDNWPLLCNLNSYINGYPGTNYTINYDAALQKMVYTFQQDWFKEDVKEFAGLVRENIFAQESLVEDSNMFYENLNAGQYAVSYAWMTPDANALKEAGKTYRYRPVFVKRDYNYAQFPLLQDPPKGGFSLAIFKDSVSEEDLPQVLRYLDYMCSDVGDKLHFWGPRSAGLFTENADGSRTYVDKELEACMVYNTPNDKNVYYGLYNVNLTNRCPFPQTVVISDVTVNAPRYVYPSLERAVGDATRYYSPAVLPGMNASEHSIATECNSYLGSFPEFNDLFQKGRDAYEKGLTKTLTAATDEDFERLYADWLATVESLDIDQALIDGIDAKFKTLNAAIMDQINNAK